MNDYMFYTSGSIRHFEISLNICKNRHFQNNFEARKIEPRLNFFKYCIVYCSDFYTRCPKDFQKYLKMWKFRFYTCQWCHISKNWPETRNSACKSIDQHTLIFKSIFKQKIIFLKWNKLNYTICSRNKYSFEWGVQNVPTYYMKKVITV